MEGVGGLTLFPGVQNDYFTSVIYPGFLLIDVFVTVLMSQWQFHSV